MTMAYTQLIMRHPDLSKVPPLSLPAGVTLRTHRSGDEKNWEEIIESAFEHHFDFDFLMNAGDYAPEKVLYLWKGGKAIATATATICCRRSRIPRSPTPFLRRTIRSLCPTATVSVLRPMSAAALS